MVILMIDLLGQKYKTYSQNIRNRINKGFTWEQVRTLKTTNEDDLKLCLESLAEILCVEECTLEEWYEIVDHVKDDMDSEVDIVIVPPAVIPAIPSFDYKLDTNPGSAWSSYKKTLFSKNFDVDTVNMIEQSSHRVLNHLSLDTRDSGPVKGLVVGNVQSGKTANMAALMAMAADLGWNLFIVLSGTIENLRIQTQERLISDLNSASNVAWVPIDNVSTSTTYPHALSKLALGDSAKHRYLMVCLKNSTRLKNLLTWLSKDLKNRSKLKILFIDDEADQAGVNAVSKEKPSKDNPDDIERTAINKGIVNLLTNRDADGQMVDKSYKALNYVAYTATPYANVLNEKPGPNSMYPSDFVACLGVSNKYFGPQQIFGVESENIDGLNIVNEIDTKEIEDIKKIYKGELSVIPNQLKNALLWFYCCFAIKKVFKDNKPVSMLIHTSQRQPDHERMGECIKIWLKGYNALSFISDCQKVYDEQTKQFTLTKFKNSYKNYGEKNVRDYPNFDEITNSLVDIFNIGIKSIIIDTDGEPDFSKGVHLCIDNCSHHLGEKGNEHIRLIYPKEKLDYPTGFIVIGGATLSRGLTIEGLVSTYFLRTIKQADTLMQMGRWFGYRIGYELLPRIWMSQDTKEKFEFLSVMDLELRQKMKYMEDKNIRPGLVGISILQYATRKLEITAKNKKKAATIVEMDFGGLATQTTMFYEDESKLKENYDLTSEFVNSLPEPSPLDNHPKSEGCILWEGIENSVVLDYIKKLNYPQGDSKFLDLKLFEKWYYDLAHSGDLQKWNVVISGVDSCPKVDLGKYKIFTVNRSRKVNKVEDGIIRIGALRAPKDLYVDIDTSNPNLEASDKECIKNSSTSEFLDVRNKAGLDKTSLLIIYVIDKNSKPKIESENRKNMDTLTDVIGITIVIPQQESTKVGDGSYIGIDLSSFEYEEGEA